MARDRASRPEAKPLRLFVAIELPEHAKARVAEAFAPWRGSFPKARWAPRENWHVTLKFLGSTWPRLVGWVQEGVTSIAAEHSRFETRLTGVGAFPSAGSARVLWAGLDDHVGRMAELSLALDAALAQEFKPESRSFRPHLTVARSEPPLHLPDGFATAILESDPFPVDHVTLFQSHFRRPAPIYDPLASFPLGG